MWFDTVGLLILRSIRKIYNPFLNWRIELFVSLVKWSLNYIKISLEILIRDRTLSCHSADITFSTKRHNKNSIFQYQDWKKNPNYASYQFLKKNVQIRNSFCILPVKNLQQTSARPILIRRLRNPNKILCLQDAEFRRLKYFGYKVSE